MALNVCILTDSVGIMLCRALNAPLAILGSVVYSPPIPPIVPQQTEYDDFACLQIIATDSLPGDLS